MTSEDRLAPYFHSPASLENTLRSKKTTAEKALRFLQRGHRVFIGSGCGEPQHLVRALEEAHDLWLIWKFYTSSAWERVATRKRVSTKDAA